uniref:NADH-ubiquinone oxidoreductase chain 2 n=1 Tax=Strongylogaster xanthocera TaxID=1385064 RepID=A0A7T8G2T4_9HYME|nr:NADH dehydrogenase subunit 2 [Strongylogaster xanthocera]
MMKISSSNILINMKNYKMNYFNLMFYMILIMSTLITINSSSWLNAWIGLEINLLSFIPLLMNFSKKIKSSNSMMIYFIVQSASSSILISSFLISNIENNFFKMNLFMNLIQLSILMKLGMIPFHWWTPKMIINLNWMNTFMFLTWQKIGPMYLMLMTNFNNMIYFSVIMSMVISTLLGMNQSSLKLILMYSSINHMSWMMVIIFLNNTIFLIYLSIYSMINFMICLMLMYFNINYINQLFKNNNQKFNSKIIMISLFLSLGGLPPLLGFLPKFISLMIMMKSSMIIESMLFIMTSILSLSFYMNPLLSIFLNMKTFNKWILKKFFINKLMFNILILNLIIILIIYTSMFNLNI